jgi:hypothetical protein
VTYAASWPAERAPSAGLPHPDQDPRADARSSSLDTGQQIGVSDNAEHERSLRRDLERLCNNDARKVTLAEFVGQAAAARFEHDPAGAIALEAMARKLDGCRRGDAFRDAVCGGYLFRPHSCHVRLCPDCERARAARLVARFADLADAMASPKFWTLTLPNVPAGALEAGIDVLLDALVHLRTLAIFVGGPCRAGHRGTAYVDVATGELHHSGDELDACAHPPHRGALALVGVCRCARCLEVDVTSDGQRVTVNGCPRCFHEPVRGGVHALEVTWSSTRADWHPHAHLLVDAPWILHREMRDAWRAVTCDAIRRAERKGAGGAGRVPPCAHRADERGLAVAPCRGASIVWVEAVRGEPGSDERRRAVRETLKYVTKGLLGQNGELLPGARAAELGELLLGLRGRRLVAGWGTFRNVHDVDEEDALDPDAYLVGPDVLPVMWGLPRRCPLCRAEARWELPIGVPRRACRPIGNGLFAWRPPPPARA